MNTESDETEPIEIEDSDETGEVLRDDLRDDGRNPNGTGESYSERNI